MRLKNQTKIKIDSFIDNSVLSVKIGKKNFIILYILIAVIFTWLCYSLFSMQIVKGSDYLAASNQNFKSRNVIRSPRGIIYDINNNKLAFNVQVYSIYIDPNEFDFGLDGSRLGNIIGMPVHEIESKITEAESYGRITLASGVDHNKYLTIVKNIEGIEGVYASVEVGRDYINYHTYSNIVGYIGDASPDDLNDKVDAHSRVGKTGLEFEFDYDIRGRDGVQINEVKLNDGETIEYVPSNPEPGDNIILNIDNEWQQNAYDLLERKVNSTKGLGGAFTIMDAENGDVKVLVSYPTIDIKEFTEGISYNSFQTILNDPRTPLLDRSYSVALPTGSIFKVISGSIGLQEGIISEDTYFNSPGCIDLAGGIRFCESLNRVLGNVNLSRAISLSSNIYFCRMGINMEEEGKGIDTFKMYTDYYGIGRSTEIILSGENTGSMASPELKRAIYGEPWYVGDICNTVIGQGMVSATPLQMLVALAAIENGGEVLKPQLVHQIKDNEGRVKQEYQKEVLRNIPIDGENLEIIRDTMRKAVTDRDGTARKLASLNMYVTGKTGTATAPVTINGQEYEQPHAWVFGAFEYQGKKYVYVTNIAHGGWGENAIDIVKNFLEQLP